MMVPTQSIIDFAQSLIRIPSQGGIDSCTQMISAVRDWFGQQEIESKDLHGPLGEETGILVQIGGQRLGSTYCLNACLDTAPIGDIDAWNVAPTAGDIIDGWLYGRGSADSKIAVSLFSHLAAQLKGELNAFPGGIDFLFDADEHTGGFGGIKSYVKACPKVSGVMIGYPGNNGVVIGARGFYRTQITVYGTSAHSGSSNPTRENSIAKASLFIQRLSGIPLPNEADPYFHFGPKLTVTAISGGQGYSTIPDRCDIYVDVRLTPSFDKACAQIILRNVVKEIDSEFPTRLPTDVEEQGSWPAYKLDEASRVAQALQTAASNRSGKEVAPIVCGPSNVGNYLASLGNDATCGYGVTYRNIHASDECVDVSSIDMVYQTYLQAVRTLLTTDR